MDNNKNNLTTNKILQTRATLNQIIRSFFNDHGFLEVDTPILSPWLIPEPSINIFVTEQNYSSDTTPRSRPLYLTPSPELWMKRIVGLGINKIYQLAHCFRNIEEQSNYHRHEFTMLEWYNCQENYIEALQRTEELIEKIFCEASKHYNLPSNLKPPIIKLSMCDLWLKKVKFDPAKYSTLELIAKAKALNIQTNPKDTWEVVFNRIFLTLIEPEIPKSNPVALMDYPARIPTLAAPSQDQNYAQRWELYINGIEIGNCFQELVNEESLNNYMINQAGISNTDLIPHRTDFILPKIFGAIAECSGVAIGIDRLFCLMMQLPNISDTIACGNLV